MDSNFAPIKHTYKDLGQFRFWCQKVLPLVYDDSLSYYELLCKVVNYLNDTITNVGLMGEDIENLYTELQTYVNNYFNNLDVQNEINNKLNTMASDGSLSVLIKPMFDAYKWEIDEIVATQNKNINDISETVDTQNENIGSTMTDVNALKSRMDTFTALQEGSTTGDAELADARVAWDGSVYPNVGDAIRTMTRGSYPFIESEPIKIIPSTYADSLQVSVSNGKYTVVYNKPSTGAPPYLGCSMSLKKTLTELVGKRVLVITSDFAFNAIRLCKNGHSWGEGNIEFNRLSATEWVLDITSDMANTVGTGNMYVAVEINPTSSYVSITFAPYIIENLDRDGSMVHNAYYAYHTDPNIHVKSASKSDISGFDYIDRLSGSTVQDTGDSVTLDKNVMKLVKVKAGGGSYVMGCVSLNTLKDKLKYIILEGTLPNTVKLTRIYYNWSNTIANLSPGINDVSGLDLVNEPNVYLMLGSYNEGGEWAVKYYLIKDDNEVVATRLLHEPEKEDNSIVCWGDSLTAMGGWTTTLSTLAGVELRNAGTGGEDVHTITARQGADVMIVNNVTIPPDTSAVQIATYSERINTAFGYKASPLLQGGSHVNPVTINGIEGTLSWTGSSYNDTTGVWTFKRTVAGESVTIDRPSAIVTKADKDWNSPYLMVIFMGQNGGYNSVDQLVQMHRLMINHASAKHTIILGLSSGTADSRKEYETTMRNVFGRYFISLREYLSTYGLADANLTPTEADTIAMNKGQVPPQLLTDGVHFTDTCRTVIGKMLYRKCCELNIF